MTRQYKEAAKHSRVVDARAPIPLPTMLSLLLILTSPLLVVGKATISSVITALENSNSSLLQYPTQLTQNLVPKQIHSHNDCKSSGAGNLCDSDMGKNRLA